VNERNELERDMSKALLEVLAEGGLEWRVLKPPYANTRKKYPVGKAITVDCVEGKCTSRVGINGRGKV
jgi:hypothetical protein